MQQTSSLYSEKLIAPRLAIVVHAYYPDLFVELADYFDNLDLDFKLYVSAPTARIQEIQEILKAKVYCHEIIEVENRGRDVAPFLQIMSQVIREQFPLVLKLHTKKSAHNAGDKWRKDTYGYLARPQQMKRHIDYLNRYPKIGLIGPPDYVIPMHTFWNTNGVRVRRLATQMGVESIDLNNYAFIAGTMFLARTVALKPLIKLGITQDDFEPEEGQYDGTLAHAIERAISYSAQAVGLAIAGADQRDVVIANQAKFAKQGNSWFSELKKVLIGRK